MGRTVFRPEPTFPVGAYQTFAISAPTATHWRRASCAEISCRAYRHGWRTAIDERTQTGQGQAYYVRKQSGRLFREHRDERGMTIFTFEAGQSCFESANHRTRIARPEILTVRPGDWRGNPGGPSAVRRHSRPVDWVEEFAEHQLYLAKLVQRG